MDEYYHEGLAQCAGPSSSHPIDRHEVAGGFVC